MGTHGALRYRRPMAVGNNLFALHINHAGRLRPTGLDHVAFRKTCIGTSEPLGQLQYQPYHHHVDTRGARRSPRPITAGNNLCALRINHADRLRPTGLGYVAFRKTCIGTSGPQNLLSIVNHATTHVDTRGAARGYLVPEYDQS